MYDDSEEEIDDEESEYVYHRDQGRPAQVEFDDFVRPAAQVTPAAPAPILPIKEAARTTLPAVFSSELDQLDRSTDISVKRLQTAAQISVSGPRSFGEPVLTILLDVDSSYPKTSPEFHLLPPKGLKIREIRHVDLLLEDSIVRLIGQPVVNELVALLRKWLNDASFRKELEEAEERTVKAKADEIARKEQALREQKDMDNQRLEAAKIPVWQPRTSAEEDQRMPPEGQAPCRVVTDMNLPRTGFLCAARVGGRVFFYGGMLDASHYSDDLYILHVATRRVEVRHRPSAAWPPALANAAAVAVGKSMYIFGGVSLQPVNQNGWGSSMTTQVNADVWELDTVSLEWHKVARMATPRFGCTATVLDNRRVLIYGGMSQSNISTNYLNLVEVFDTVTSTFISPNITSVAGHLPLGRYGHAAVLYQDKLVVYGGRGYVLHADTWVLDTKTWTWYGPLPTTSTGVPGRAYHSMCLVGGRLMIYGGEYSENHELNDLLVYDIEERRFYSKPIAMDTEARSGHVAVLTGGTMFVVGGARSTTHNIRKNSRVRINRGVIEWSAVGTAVALALAPATIPVPGSRLLIDLMGLCSESFANSFADLRVGPAATPMHAFLLQARCPSLVTAITAALASNSLMEISHLTSPVSYKAFFDYVYTGNPMAQFPAIGILNLPALTEDVVSGAVKAQLIQCATALSLAKLKERIEKQVQPELRYYSEVMEDLGALTKRPVHADFTLVAGTVRLQINKALLACRSEYFRAMLGAGMSEARKGELVLPAEMSEVSARALHEFIYTDELEASCAEQAMELVPFGDIVQLSRLQRLAERLIMDAFDMTDLDSVLALTALAEESHSQSLLARCLFLLAQHFGLMRTTASPGWAMLSPEVQAKARKLAN